MNRIKLAVIADDFTGGADAASFLKRKHANVVLLTGIPLMLPDCDCVVFALKIRSVPVSDAIKKVHDVESGYFFFYPSDRNPVLPM